MSGERPHAIPRDPVLPELGAALDEERMRTVFRRHLGDRLPAPPLDCRIERIKYKPSRNCHVCYRLFCGGDPAGAVLQQSIVGARFYPPGGSLSRFRKAVAGDAGRGAVVHIAELDCVAWLFPADRKLRYLDAVTDPDFLSETLPLVVANHIGPDWAIDEAHSRMIRYVPEHTCSVRADCELVRRTGGGRRRLTLYGKSHYNDAGRHIERVMRRLWLSAPRRAGALRIPKPLMYQPSYRLLWQTGVPGVPLSELCRDERRFLAALAGAAGQLGLLHGIAPAAGSEPGTDADVRTQLASVVDLLSRFDNECRRPADALIERLAMQAAAADSGRRVLLHGDLHLKNILADGEIIYLIDLDGCRPGDPLQDIGSFIAALLAADLTGGLPRGLAGRAGAAFLQHYPAAMPPSALRWHIAAALVRERVARSVTRLKPGRFNRLGDLIELASRVLAGTFAPDWLCCEPRPAEVPELRS